MNLISTLRKPRVGPFAIFDVVASLSAACVLAPKLGIPRKTAVLAAIPVGIVVHEFLRIDTPLNRLVFGRQK